MSWLILLTLLCPATNSRATCTLRVGTSGDYAPFSVKTTTADYEGLDVDIARRLATDLACAVQFVPFEWPELNAQLAAGSIDLVASGITMRPERALIGRFSRPYAVTGAVALVRAADAERFGKVDDLNQPGVRIAVNAGGHLERVARALLPRATIRPQADNRALPKTLRDGSADAVMTDSAEARAWLADDLRAVGPLTHDYKALLLSLSAADLVPRIDAWLQAREMDGWLAQQRARYLGTDAALDATRADREAVTALIRLRLELMPAVGAAKRKANLPIEDRTQERRVLVRVAAQQPTHAKRVANVYRELIDLAKAVQRAHPKEKTTATLTTLRDVITRIDEQLVREIDRPHTASKQDWLGLLAEAVTLPGIDDSMRARLANALSDGPDSGSDPQSKSGNHRWPQIDVLLGAVRP